jgi:hypothetical protein
MAGYRELKKWPDIFDTVIGYFVEKLVGGADTMGRIEFATKLLPLALKRLESSRQHLLRNM